MGEGFAAVRERAGRGDPAAFAVLWRDLNPRLMRYVRVVAPDAPDTVIDRTWAALIGSLRRIPADESRWRVRAFRAARREVRRAGTVGDEPVLGVRMDPFTEQALVQIAALPPDEAEAVILRTAGGLDDADIARVMGARPRRVSALLTSAMHRLRDNDAVSLQTVADLGVGRDGPPNRRRLGVPVLAAAYAALLALGGTTAAAYAGVLPQHLQEVAHSWLDAPPPRHGQVPLASTEPVTSPTSPEPIPKAERSQDPGERTTRPPRPAPPKKREISPARTGAPTPKAPPSRPTPQRPTPTAPQDEALPTPTDPVSTEAPTPDPTPTHGRPASPGPPPHAGNGQVRPTPTAASERRPGR